MARNTQNKGRRQEENTGSEGFEDFEAEGGDQGGNVQGRTGAGTTQTINQDFEREENEGENETEFGSTRSVRAGGGRSTKRNVGGSKRGQTSKGRTTGRQRTGTKRAATSQRGRKGQGNRKRSGTGNQRTNKAAKGRTTTRRNK